MPEERSLIADDQEHHRLQKALQESEILRELAALSASSLDLNHIIQVLVKRTTQVCEVERCAVWLLDESRNVLRPVAYHLSSQHINSEYIRAGDQIWYRSSLRFDDPFIHRLLTENETIVVEDLRAEPTIRQVAEMFLVRSILLVALVRDGRPVGMLSLDDPGKQRSFSEELQQLIRAIGQQAAIAIDNARLYEQAQEERKRVEQLIKRAQAIYQVAMAVNSGKDLPVVLEIAIDHLVSGLNADSGTIVHLEDDTLRLASTTRPSRTIPTTPTTTSLAHLPHCREAASTGVPLVVTTKQAEEAERYWYQQLGLRNVMIVPLMAGITSSGKQVVKHNDVQQSTHCVGFAFVNYANPNYYPSKGQFAFAQDIAAQCALAIEKDQLLSNARQAVMLATERANTLNAVFQAMTEGIAVLNPDGQVYILNNAASHFLGVPVNTQAPLGTFLTRYPTYTLHGQRIPNEDFPLSRALRGERVRGERFVTKRSDGTECIVEVNVAPLLDSTGKQMGLVSAFRDITEPIRVERRIRQALETMLRVAEAVSGVTDIKDILYRVLDMTLATLNCHHGSVHLYDQTQHLFMPLLSIGLSAEIEAQWLKEQNHWIIPEGNDYKGVYAQLMQGHATLISAEQHPYVPNIFKDTMILAAPITYTDHLLGLMILDRSPRYKSEVPSEQLQRDFTIWDIAIIEGIAQFAGVAMEQARWQQEALNARTSESAMREANALKDEFLAITAHEFRTPLTVILAHCQMALRTLRRITTQEQLDERLSKTLLHMNDGLSSIEEQTHQLTNIVNTFLEVTQLNRGQLALNLEAVNLAEIVQHVVANQSTTSTKHEIQCFIEPCEQPYVVMGDNARLRQILANLVQNAIKYSPLGGPIPVSLSQYKESNGRAIIRVSVADKGIGILKEAQSRLFERFYRAPNTEGSKTRGIGLGLYIVAEILRLHGGTISVESSGVYGEGSRFTFTLPALESDAAEGDRTA